MFPLILHTRPPKDYLSRGLVDFFKFEEAAGPWLGVKGTSIATTAGSATRAAGKLGYSIFSAAGAKV